MANDCCPLGVNYQQARAVGGAFYDFISLENGRIAFIVADVTDKDVTAAMEMANTRNQS